MSTQPSRGRIDKTPGCLVDIKDRPYIIHSIKDNLFEVIFLSREDFYRNLGSIIQNAKDTITENFFTNTSNFLEIILTESLQNIQKHSFIEANTDQRVAPSKFSIKKGQLQYTVEISNVCEKNDFNKLKGISESLNKASMEDLKTAYNKQMSEGTVSERDGAGLGLLIMAKTIKRYNKNRDFTIINIENIGQITKNDQTPKELINIKITINMPFPESKNITNDHRTDDQTSLHKSA